ncbi:MAG TPA: glycosyltransferase family 2 protein [Vicinamibacterales bacterium]|nr:glycosyltransferase family 2 protein [Vicinamibacterales bacterium]
MSSPITVVAILAAYNEEDVIEEVVQALIDEGVGVYFIDNASTDRTLALVKRFEGKGVIGVESFRVSEGDHVFAWEKILARKEALAHQIEADWFIHHDADEFRESPWAGETLRDAITRVGAAGYNAIDFEVLDFRPTTADPAEARSVRHRLQYYEPARSFDRLQIKCWKKSNEPVVLTRSGGHNVEFEGRRVFPIRFLLRHYSIRSQAHGERKVFQERLPAYDAAERAGGWHVQYDNLSEGASFVRDPATLRRYDPGAVRLDLFVRHRDVEALEQRVAEQQTALDGLGRETGELRRRLDDATTTLEEARAERDQQTRAVEAARVEIDRLRGAHEQAVRDLDAALAMARDKDIALADLRGETRRLTGDLELARRAGDSLEAQRSGLESECARLQAEIAARQAQLVRAEQAIEQLMQSKSWKLTAPLRAADRLFRGRS